MRDVVNTGILSLSFLALFGVAELLFYKFHIKAELTRKLVHAGTGLLTLLFPIMLGNQWLVLFLCATFALITLASLRFNFLRSINGIERRSHGSISYPVAVYACYLVYDHYQHSATPTHDPYLYFYIPILTLAICDPIAAIAGKTLPYGRYTIGKDAKTIVGSLAFLLSSLLLTPLICFSLSPNQFAFPQILPLALVIASVASVAEALSGKGIDNITIPFTVVIVLILFGGGGYAF